MISVIIIVIDQVTKLYFNQHLQLGQSIELLPVLNWTLAYNYGAAFSFLHNAGGWQRWFFAAIALVVSTGLTVWLTKLGQNTKFLALAIALLLGGAIVMCMTVLAMAMSLILYMSIIKRGIFLCLMSPIVPLLSVQLC